MFPIFIFLLGFFGGRTIIATQVLVTIFVNLLRDHSPPIWAGINSNNYLPDAIANVERLRRGSIAESLLHSCHSSLDPSLLFKLDFLPQALEWGDSNYCILGVPYSIVSAKSYKFPALSIVHEPGPIPHIVDIWLLQPPSRPPTDEPNHFYGVAALVGLLSGHGGSSSLYIGKHIIEVLEVFHNNLSNTRQPLYCFPPVPALWNFHSHIVKRNVHDWFQVGIEYFSGYRDKCQSWNGSSLYQSGWPRYAFCGLES